MNITVVLNAAKDLAVLRSCIRFVTVRPTARSFAALRTTVLFWET
jgi:hypothetical protein